MKTLKQWYDALSESAQKWIDANCSAWFDKNQADYYAKFHVDANDKDVLHELMLSNSGLSEYDSNTNSRTYAKRYLILLKYLNINHPELVSESTLDENVFQCIKSRAHEPDTWLLLSDKFKDQGFLNAFEKYGRLPLKNYLYLIKDFDEIKIDWEKCNLPVLTPEVVEIIGKKNAQQVVEASSVYDLGNMIKYNEEHEFFDEIFFCESSPLIQKEKMSLLNEIYANTRNLPSERSVADFFKRIVAVDHSYLRFLYQIILRYPAIAMKLYTEKKPENEQNTGDSHRYNKEIRKLFVIAHTCALKRISKVKSGICKEIAPLLKIYGYKWNEIYDAMYPEDSYLN